MRAYDQARLDGSHLWHGGVGLMVMLMLLSWARLGLGAPGDLDLMFGAGGIVTTDSGGSDFAEALLLQPDGTLVVGGSSTTNNEVNRILLARYLPDGRLDATFGLAGKIATPFQRFTSSGALLLQSDGKLVVAGFTADGVHPGDVLLARYQPDGTLDGTFGTGGFVTTDFGGAGGDSAAALLLQPDGKLVMGGTSSPAPGLSLAILARYLPDGQLDATFGTGGKVAATPSLSNGFAALLLQSDGKLVAAGSTGANRVSPPHLLLARFHSDGHLDPTFGTGGQVRTDFAGFAAGLLRQADGQLVMAGISFDSGNGDFVLARYDGDGHLDATFGTGGVVTLDFGGRDEASGLIQQPDGKLVVAGWSLVGNTGDVVLGRVHPDGSLDPTFGTGGRVRTDVGGFEFVTALIQQPDGKLVVAGRTDARGTQDILLARYQTAGCPRDDPGDCRQHLEQFVKGFYEEALERAPSAAEVADWVAYLEADPTVATTSAMIHAFFDGPEFRARPLTLWDYVASLYQAILGRWPAPEEATLWASEVLGRLNTAIPMFINSPEFHSLVPICQDHPAVSALVTRLYQEALGRTPSTAEVAEWTDAIMTWCDITSVVADFLNSIEYLSLPRTLADHVTILYQALLAREPAVAEEALWVTYLAGQLALVADGFIASAEFQARWQQLFLPSAP
jgi:uncharacterized delta-60 repeat protein